MVNIQYITAKSGVEPSYDIDVMEYNIMVYGLNFKP